MYITVRYGESQQEIFNPNCKTYLLLKTIKTKCKCGREADIDLSDESGNIKNLRDPGFQQRYATEFLDEREKLILLKVETMAIIRDVLANVKAILDKANLNILCSDEPDASLTLKLVGPSNEGILYTPMLQAGDTALSDDFMARLAIKGSEQQTEQKRVKSSTRRRKESALPANENPKENHRQNSREKGNEKLKPGGKADKRHSARSKR